MSVRPPAPIVLASAETMHPLLTEKLAVEPILLRIVKHAVSEALVINLLVGVMIVVLLFAVTRRKTTAGTIELFRLSDLL